MIKHCQKFAFLFLLAALSTAAAQKPQVVGYVFAHESPLKSDSVDAFGMTRINYAFANIKDGRIIEGSKSDGENFAQLTALRKKNPELTILVSVGGWEWSGNFSSMALTKASRSLFIDSTVDFLRKYDLDGLDIDWEYPGMEGATKNFRPEDKQNFTALVTELRSRFDREATKSHRHYLLTMAAGSGQDFLDHTEMAKVAAQLDTVNLMCYDYYEPFDGGKTGNHSPLYADPADPQHASSDWSVQAFIKAGVPAHKILLGVPFYGHVWSQVPATNNGLFQVAKAAPKTYAGYHKVQDDQLAEGYVRYWDDISKVPYLYNAQDKVFVSYEDPESLQVKSQYILDSKLGGIMFWSYETDSHGQLLRAINSVLRPEVVKNNATLKNSTNEGDK